MKPFRCMQDLTALDTQVVTVGTAGSLPNRTRGYNTVGALGSIADGTSNIYAGAAITRFYYDENGGGGADFVQLAITGATNTGWTTVTVAGTPFLRTDAGFAAGVWTWTGITNPFGAVPGSLITCIWT